MFLINGNPQHYFQVFSLPLEPQEMNGEVFHRIRSNQGDPLGFFKNFTDGNRLRLIMILSNHYKEEALGNRAAAWQIDIGLAGLINQATRTRLPIQSIITDIFSLEPQRSLHFIARQLHELPEGEFDFLREFFVTVIEDLIDNTTQATNDLPELGQDLVNALENMALALKGLIFEERLDFLQQHPGDISWPSASSGVKAFSWVEQKPSSPIGAIEVLYNRLVSASPPIIDTSLANFRAAFSGENLLTPLGIRWLIRGRNGETSKPSLLHFIHCLFTAGKILDDTGPYCNQQINMIFIDADGRPFKNIRQSKNGAGSNPVRAKEIKRIIDNLP